jgi:hypothetical protein
MKVFPLSLCMMTPSEQIDILLSGIDGKYILHYRKEKGNDKETIDYIEKEIQQLISTKQWPLKMKKAK